MYPEKKLNNRIEKETKKKKIGILQTKHRQYTSEEMLNLLESPLDSKEIKPVNPKGI